MQAVYRPLIETLEGDVRALIRDVAVARRQVADTERRCDEQHHATVQAFIEILDSFDRVSKSIEAKRDLLTDQMQIWIRNFSTVKRLVERQLATRGVERLAAATGVFDPEWQTILDTIQDPERADGDIVAEVRPGYRANGRPVRKAEVRVVRNTE